MISKVVTSLTQESPDGYIQPSAISLFKLTTKQHDWDRKKEFRNTLRALPINFARANFIAIVTTKTMQNLMEIAQDLNLVTPFAQWLYVVSDTSGQEANISLVSSLIGEGSNIAFVYNTTTTNKNCVVRIFIVSYK